jgi:uncharacterized membrane protein
MNRLPLPVRAFGLGFVCGMRSLLGPALVRRKIAAQKADSPAQAVAASPLSAALLPILSAGELIGDKLPGTPDRTMGASVVFRAASGASVAASLYDLKRESPVTGAVIGAAGAIVATYGIFYLRRTISRRKAVPDVILGLTEDALAAGLGLLMLRDTSSD